VLQSQLPHERGWYFCARNTISEHTDSADLNPFNTWELIMAGGFQKMVTFGTLNVKKLMRMPV
jgi:hypothetical protein